MAFVAWIAIPPRLDKVREDDRLEVVEAAGVEPASEKVYREKATCVSGSVVLVRLLRNRQERGGLA